MIQGPEPSESSIDPNLDLESLQHRLFILEKQCEAIPVLEKQIKMLEGTVQAALALSREAASFEEAVALASANKALHRVEFFSYSAVVRLAWRITRGFRFPLPPEYQEQEKTPPPYQDNY